MPGRQRRVFRLGARVFLVGNKLPIVRCAAAGAAALTPPPGCATLWVTGGTKVPRRARFGRPEGAGPGGTTRAAVYASVLARNARAGRCSRRAPASRASPPRSSRTRGWATPRPSPTSQSLTNLYGAPGTLHLPTRAPASAPEGAPPSGSGQKMQRSSPRQSASDRQTSSMKFVSVASGSSSWLPTPGAANGSALGVSCCGLVGGALLEQALVPNKQAPNKPSAEKRLAKSQPFTRREGREPS